MATQVPLGGPTTGYQRVFWGADTQILISGQQFTSVATVKLKYGFEIKEELVTGSNYPYTGTGGFKGSIDIEALGSSDMRLEGLASQVSGIVPTVEIQWIEKDAQSTMSGRTWTCSGVKINNFEHGASKDGAVMYTLKGTLLIDPMVS